MLKCHISGNPLGPGGSKGDLKSMATERHRNSEQGGATLPTCFPGSLSSLSGAPFWPISDGFCDQFRSILDGFWHRYLSSCHAFEMPTPSILDVQIPAPLAHPLGRAKVVYPAFGTQCNPHVIKYRGKVTSNSITTIIVILRRINLDSISKYCHNWFQ